MLDRASMAVLRLRTIFRLCPNYTIIKLLSIKLCEMGMSLTVWRADFVWIHPAMEDLKSAER